MKIYVGNLPWSVDESKLKELFSAYESEEITLIKDKFSGRSKGFGFIEMSTEEEAKKAIEMFNEQDLEGRKMVVNEARPMKKRF